VRGFASDRLGIRRCMGGPQMLRGLKLKNGQVTTDGPKMGGSKLHPHKIGPLWGHLPMAQIGGCKIASPNGPMWGQLPIVGFGSLSVSGVGIGKGGPPPYIFWRVWKGPPYVFLGGHLPKKRVALRASPGIVARRLAAMLLCWRLI